MNGKADTVDLRLSSVSESALKGSLKVSSIPPAMTAVRPPAVFIVRTGSAPAKEYEPSLPSPESPPEKIKGMGRFLRRTKASSGDMSTFSESIASCFFIFNSS